jgi:hypothetical protein
MDKVKIYSNQAFEQKTEKEVNDMAAKLQVLLNEFNALNVGPVDQSELPLLCSNPQMLFDAKLEKSVIVPKGMNRSKYIELLELPKLDKLLQAHKKFVEVRTQSLENFRIAGDTIELVPERVELTMDGQSVYVADGSPQHKAALKLLQFLELANDLNPISQYQLLATGRRNDFECFFNLKGTGIVFRNTAVLDRVKLIEFIKNASK